MARQQMAASICDTNLRTRFQTSVCLMMLVAVLVFSPTAQAQTLQVLHSFTGGEDGSHPYTGLSMDNAGNLYGVTGAGGFQGNNCNQIQNIPGCGVVFKLARQGGNWLFHPLYQFQGSPDGAVSFTRVIPGPDGALYGATRSGGTTSEDCTVGCGTVFKLTPPASFCRAFQCNWIETQLYVFSGSDGFGPTGELAFDASGNLYGTATGGGSEDAGIVYQLTPAPGRWTLTALHNFAGEPDGELPQGGVQLDPAGNVYGTTYGGGYGSNGGDGMVFQLVPSQSGWQMNTLYVFQPQGGSNPWAGVTLDRAGNLYGSTGLGDPGAVVFQLSPSSGDWIYNTLYTFSFQDGGPLANLVMDAAGNLYGTTYQGGSHNFGSVFKLTPSGGGWTYTDLHDFTGGSDGGHPYSNVLVDAHGNLFGTASIGGSGYGVVWEITP